MQFRAAIRGETDKNEVSFDFLRIDFSAGTPNDMIGTLGMLNMLTFILYSAWKTIAVLNSFKEFSRRAALEEAT